MKYELKDEQISAINKVLNSSGSPQVEIRVKNKEIVIYRVDARRIGRIERQRDIPGTMKAHGPAKQEK